MTRVLWCFAASWFSYHRCSAAQSFYSTQVCQALLLCFPLFSFRGCSSTCSAQLLHRPSPLSSCVHGTWNQPKKPSQTAFKGPNAGEPPHRCSRSVNKVNSLFRALNKQHVYNLNVKAAEKQRASCRGLAASKRNTASVRRGEGLLVAIRAALLNF